MTVQKGQTNKCLDSHKRTLTCHYKEIRKAKSSSWRYCQGIEDVLSSIRLMQTTENRVSITKNTGSWSLIYFEETGDYEGEIQSASCTCTAGGTAYAFMPMLHTTHSVYIPKDWDRWKWHSHQSLVKTNYKYTDTKTYCSISLAPFTLQTMDIPLYRYIRNKPVWLLSW
jgi:hypothetical protein